jgi:TrmH family RNA methyltransferase
VRSRLAIASRQNPRFKELRSLAEDPRRHGAALAEGIHLVATCIERGVVIKLLVISDSGLKNEEVGRLVNRAGGIDCLQLSDVLYREVTGIGAPTGIAAVIEIPAASDVPLQGDTVLLDAVQDAGNVGAILRTAAAAGIHDVMLGAGCAGAWNMKVLRAAQGAHFSLSIREQVDLAAALAGYGGLSVATVAHGGVEIHDTDLSGPVCWLFGNEGAGLSPAMLAVARIHATIPLAAGTESLNVAAAAAICLFEAIRQRRKVKRPALGGPFV